MTMKPLNTGYPRSIWQLAVPAAVCVLTYGAQAAGPASSKHGLQAKFEYCQDCHGPSGQGYRGFYPIPRLAGQQPIYFENQMRAYVERRRVNPIMANVAHVLSPAMIADLASNSHTLNP